MKKIFILATVVLALASCTKKNDSLTTVPKPTFKYDASSAESIIKAADPALYERCKSVFHPTGLKTTTEPIVKLAHGLCNPNLWYCQPMECICFVEVIFPKLTTEDGTPIEGGEANSIGANVIVNTLNETYSNKDATIILVTADSPLQYKIEELNATVDVDGTVSYSFVKK